MSHQLIVEIAVVLTLIAAITFVSIALFGRPARSGEIVDCAERHGLGRWVYRIVDERKCWFPASRGINRGEDKPREELRWRLPDIPPVSIMAPEPEAPPEPTEFEQRWHGDKHR